MDIEMNLTTYDLNSKTEEKITELEQRCSMLQNLVGFSIADGYQTMLLSYGYAFEKNNQYTDANNSYFHIRLLIGPYYDQYGAFCTSLFNTGYEEFKKYSPWFGVELSAQSNKVGLYIYPNTSLASNRADESKAICTLTFSRDDGFNLPRIVSVERQYCVSKDFDTIAFVFEGSNKAGTRIQSNDQFLEDLKKIKVTKVYNNAISTLDFKPPISFAEMKDGIEGHPFMKNIAKVFNLIP